MSSLRKQNKDLIKLNENFKLLNDKLIKEIGESREEKKEVYKILNCEDESLKECSERHNVAISTVLNRNSDLEIDLEHQKKETNGLDDLYESTYDDLKECERILDIIDIDDTNQVDPLICDRDQIKNGECIAVNERELNILKEKQDASDSILKEKEDAFVKEEQNLKKQNITDLQEAHAEYVKVVFELGEAVTRSERNRDEIEKAKEVLQCDSSDEELEDCANRFAEKNKKELKETAETSPRATVSQNDHKFTRKEVVTQWKQVHTLGCLALPSTLPLFVALF